MDQIDALDHEGRTPIMLAADNNCYESVQVLLENGANVDVRDAESKTVLHYAIGSAEVLKEILKVWTDTQRERERERQADRERTIRSVIIVFYHFIASVFPFSSAFFSLNCYI